MYLFAYHSRCTTDALEFVQAVRQTPNQILKSYAFSMSDLASSKAALDAACVPHGGKSPDAMFLCAGGSKPSFWVEETESSMRDGMDMGYYCQAFSALVSLLILPFGTPGLRLVQGWLSAHGR